MASVAISAILAAAVVAVASITRSPASPSARISLAWGARDVPHVGIVIDASPPVSSRNHPCPLPPPSPPPAPPERPVRIVDPRLTSPEERERITADLQSGVNLGLSPGILGLQYDPASAMFLNEYLQSNWSSKGIRLQACGRHKQAFVTSWTDAFEYTISHTNAGLQSKETSAIRGLKLMHALDGGI